MEKIMLPHVRDLGQTIGDPFLFVRANFKLLFRGFLYYAVPPLLIAAGLSVFGYKTTMSASNGFLSSGRFGSTRGLYDMFGVMGALAYLIYILTLVFQQIYVSQFIVLKELNEDVTNAEVLAGLKSNWKNIAVSFLALFLVAIVIGIFFGIIFASSAVLGEYFSGLLVFLFFLAICYAFIPLSNFLFIRLREKLSVMDSLVKSFRITNGNWWKTVVAWFVMFVIFYAFLIVLIMPFMFLIALLSMHNARLGESSPVAIAILGVAGSFAVFVYFFVINMMHVFTGINYFSLSEKYDSYHLKAEISQLGEREDRNVHRQEGEY